MVKLVKYTLEKHKFDLFRNLVMLGKNMISYANVMDKQKKIAKVGQNTGVTIHFT